MQNEAPMTNTETCMREMRYIAALFSRSRNFDEQWILFKSYLNTVHSLVDNDPDAKSKFIANDLMNFILVLRNILHHQPAKWHFGKHDVFPTEMNFSMSQTESAKSSTTLSLIIPQDSLENPELQEELRRKYPKQLNILKAALKKYPGHFYVFNLIRSVQIFVESYCKGNGHYTDKYDNQPEGYRVIKKA